MSKKYFIKHLNEFLASYAKKVYSVVQGDKLLFLYKYILFFDLVWYDIINLFITNFYINILLVLVTMFTNHVSIQRHNAWYCTYVALLENHGIVYL